MKYRKAYGLAITSVIFGSLGPSLFLKLLGTRMDMRAGVAYFMLIGGLAMLFAAGWRREMAPLFAGNARRLMSVWGRLVLAGIFWPLTFLCFVVAMRQRSITEMSILFRLGPVFVVWISVVLGMDKVQHKLALLGATLVCLLGTLLILVGQATSLRLTDFAVVGVLAALMSAGSRVLIISLTNGGIPKTSAIGGAMLIGFAWLGGYALIRQPGTMAWPSLAQWWLLVILGVVTVALAEFFWQWGKDAAGQSPVQIAFVEYLGPVFTAILAYFINHEGGFNYVLLLLSLALISVGVSLASYSKDGGQGILRQMVQN